MKAAVIRETLPGERRVALTPAVLPSLAKAGVEVLVEQGAGIEAGYPDRAYEENGARVVQSADELLSADVILRVRFAGTDGEEGRRQIDALRPGQVVIAMCDPLGSPQTLQPAAERGITLLALELLPRITRAQSMDVLSSMATIAGYRAVLLAAQTLPKMFPMMMTAAGTIAPARVFIMGVGVAGLQAIATAKRLGAVVSANDIRPAVKEQVQSLGAKFVELELEGASAEDKGGYAKEMGEEFLRKQRELIARVVAESDVVITTAAVPGKRAPVLVTREMVTGMGPGSVIVDAAAERGGNCELTRPDETVVENGVTILGPTNLPAGVPYHASQMYARNVATFLLHLIKDGQVQLDLEDEITRETLVACEGRIVHARVAEVLGIETPRTAPSIAAGPAEDAADAGRPAAEPPASPDPAPGEGGAN